MNGSASCSAPSYQASVSSRIPLMSQSESSTSMPSHFNCFTGGNVLQYLKRDNDGKWKCFTKILLSRQRLCRCT